MPQQLPVDAIARLITYPFPAAGGDGTGAGTPPNDFGAGTTSARTARIMHAAARRTLEIVASRQAAADETGDPEVSAKILTVNRGTLHRFRDGFLAAESPKEFMPVCVFPFEEPMMIGPDQWVCWPTGVTPEGLWGPGEPGGPGEPRPITPELKIAIGTQCVLLGRNMPNPDLGERVIKDLGLPLANAGLDQLGLTQLEF
ncbi:hypothetical protein ACX6XY_25155 [Streptomyces sp. O3]